MSLYDNSVMAATIPEEWDQAIDEARYAKSVLLPRIKTKTDTKATKVGDTVNMTYEGKLTVSSVNSSTGAFTPTTNSFTPVIMLLDQWKVVAAESLDLTDAQSFSDIHEGFPAKAGQALAEHYDNVLGALYADFTTNTPVGSSDTPVTFDEIAINTSNLRLDDRDVPMNDRSFIINPAGFRLGISTRPVFINASDAGTSQSLLSTGLVGVLKAGGVPMYITTQLTTAGNAKAGFLLHRSAMAMGFTFKNKYRSGDGLASNKLTEISAVESVYGVKTFRPDHAVVLYLKQS